MASFPNSVVSFTAKSAGQTIQPTHVTDLQDEVTAIEQGYLQGTAPLNSSNSTVVNLSVSGNSTFVGNVTVTGTFTFGGAIKNSSVVTLTDGATPALNAALGNTFYLAAAGNRTIAVPSNASAGQKIVIIHFASGGARTLALNSGAGGFRFGSDVTALTQTASGKNDYIGCIYNGVDTKWDVVAYSKGY